MRLQELDNKGTLSITPQGLKVRGIRGVIGPGEWLFHNETGQGGLLVKVAKNGKIQMDIDDGKLVWSNIEDWHWAFE